jgi:hypothetical protein
MAAKDEKLLELNFTKVMVGRKGSVSSQLISNAVPRFDVFKLT